MLMDFALYKTIGEVFEEKEYSKTARQAFAHQLIFDAVFDCDIEIIDRIVKRIDGGSPDAEKREGYANIFGAALDEVLSMTSVQQLTIKPDDPVIITLAKVAIYIAMSQPGKNVQGRKAKHIAIDMVLDRLGGKKVKPVQALDSGEYVDPDWMALPSSN